MPHDEESKGRPLLLTAASLEEQEGSDLRRDSYTDSILCAKVLPKYADTFSLIKRSAPLIDTGRGIQLHPFWNTSRPQCDEQGDGAMQFDAT